MKFIRSTPSLQHLIGVEATLDELIAIVRAEMRRRLRPDERDPYQGIVHSGIPNIYFQSIYTKTTQELIIGQVTGFMAEPLDRPGQVYCFAAGLGAIAYVKPGFIKAFGEKNNLPLRRSEKTLDELESEVLLRMISDDPFVESALKESASDFVYWACGQTPLDLLDTGH